MISKRAAVCVLAVLSILPGRASGGNKFSAGTAIDTRMPAVNYGDRFLASLRPRATCSSCDARESASVLPKHREIHVETGPLTRTPLVSGLPPRARRCGFIIANSSGRSKTAAQIWPELQFTRRRLGKGEYLVV